MLLRNLRIAPRSALGFTILALLAMLVGGFSLLQMRQMNQASAEVDENWLPSIKALGEEKGRKAATAMLVRFIRDNAIAAPNLDPAGAWIARWMYVNGSPPVAPSPQAELPRGGVAGEGVGPFEV